MLDHVRERGRSRTRLPRRSRSRPAVVPRRRALWLGRRGSTAPAVGGRCRQVEENLCGVVVDAGEPGGSRPARRIHRPRCGLQAAPSCRRRGPAGSEAGRPAAGRRPRAAPGIGLSPVRRSVWSGVGFPRAKTGSAEPALADNQLVGQPVLRHLRRDILRLPTNCGTRRAATWTRRAGSTGLTAQRLAAARRARPGRGKLVGDPVLADFETVC